LWQILIRPNTDKQTRETQFQYYNYPGGNYWNDSAASSRRHLFEKQNRLPGAYAYSFSRLFSRLAYDPTYPGNPSTFAEHIRKYRKDRGLSCPHRGSSPPPPRSESY